MIKKRYGVDRGDGKRPDGMTIFPFSQGRCLVWDSTCVNTFADSRLGDASLKAGAAAKKAEDGKRRKYSQLAQRFRFEPVAFESNGACGPTTRSFIRELGTRMSVVSGDSREVEWLLQRFSIAVVRGNAASILLDGSSDLACSDQAQHLSREPRHSLNRFSSPSFLRSPPSLPEPAPPSSPPRNHSPVVLGTPYCHNICVGPDETAPPPPQLPNPPTEAPDGDAEYEQDRPGASYNVWDRALPKRIEGRYIPTSLHWFQGRFHDRSQMVASFKKDCRSWLWKNRPADFRAVAGDVLESSVVAEPTCSTHALPPISEKQVRSGGSAGGAVWGAAAQSAIRLGRPCWRVELHSPQHRVCLYIVR